MDNAERASTVDGALADFASRMYGDPFGEEPATLAGDMICDILHWVAQRSSTADAARALRSGLAHFCAEHAETGGDEDSAMGHVTVSIDASGFSESNEAFQLRIWSGTNEVQIEGFSVARAREAVLKGRC